MGGEVILVSGPTNLAVPQGIKEFVQVRTAEEMNEAVLTRFEDMDIAIACTAVATYRPKIYSKEKIKKKDGDLVIELERNPDILFQYGKKKITSNSYRICC